VAINWKNLEKLLKPGYKCASWKNWKKPGILKKSWKSWGNIFENWHPRLQENALPGLKSIALNIYWTFVKYSINLINTFN